jgi:hypothetical protein
VAGDLMRRAASDAQVAPKGATLPARPESRADRARRFAYRTRFAAFYFVLAVVAGAAIGALVVLVSRGGPAPAPAWSEWKPEGSAERRAAQIGDHVSDGYRLPSGRPLATVTYTGPPTVTGPDGAPFQVRTVAVQPDTSGGQAEEDDIDTHNAGNTVMFTLCGLGPACSIREGQPTPARLALLQRESLELALYAFKYIESLETMIALLPPRPDGSQGVAIFLERGDVRPSLERPLNQTLTAPLTPGIGEMDEEELATVQRITRSRMYTPEYIQAQDGSPVMVLSPALSSSTLGG